MVINYEQIKAVNAELKTTDVKGKDYAEVPQRVTAFRKLHPMGSIRTDIVSLEDGVCVIRARHGLKTMKGMTFFSEQVLPTKRKVLLSSTRLHTSRIVKHRLLEERLDSAVSESTLPLPVQKRF